MTKYFANERFIHDDLLVRAQATVDLLYKLWREDGRIDPSLLTWPAEPIVDDLGKKFEGVCFLSLPKQEHERTLVIRNTVERTKAYALFLVEQHNEVVRALLETPHGTRCWNLPIIRSGDAFRLGEATIHDNRENVGLLWSSHQAEA